VPAASLLRPALVAGSTLVFWHLMLRVCGVE
jgi:hypothetical protein